MSSEVTASAATDQPTTFLAAYHAALQARGYQEDAAQRHAAQELAQCCEAWASYKAKRRNTLERMVRHPPLPRGVYLWGGVGRGKTFLMDLFFAQVPLTRKTRLHFHEFMRDVHRQLHGLQGIADPLDELARRVARRHRLICFDEFHISDVTDALILHRLLQALFAQRVSLVATSNFEPGTLYPDGLHRERILPAIDLLREHMQVVQVDAGRDYRQLALAREAVYLDARDPATEQHMAAYFQRLGVAQPSSAALHVAGREIACRLHGSGVAWFDFDALCRTPRSAQDYLDLSQRFHTVLLSGVPLLSSEEASAARRFTLLVDVFYDQRVKLVVSAAAAPELLYPRGALAHEFVRTASRLREMQSAVYLQAERRATATALAG